MKKTEILDVFGMSIPIEPEASLTTVKKLDDETVEIKIERQNRSTYTHPVHTQERFGKSADEFITEFNIRNDTITQKDWSEFSGAYYDFDKA